MLQTHYSQLERRQDLAHMNCDTLVASSSQHQGLLNMLMSIIMAAMLRSLAVSVLV
jgi:hypothetical protein